MINYFPLIYCKGIFILIFAAKNTTMAQIDNSYKLRNQEFLQEYAKQSGVKIMFNGVMYREITKGKGPKPSPKSFITVHYVGKLINGKVFDQTQKGKPATFRLAHDRAQCEIEVTIEIFNFQGQVLWSNSEHVVCSDNTYTLDWDGAALGGRPLPTGVYLVRAYIEDAGVVSSPKTGKIVVVNNK